MKAEAVIETVVNAGGELSVFGGRIHYRLPKDHPEKKRILNDLRENKAAVLEYFREQRQAHRGYWPDFYEWRMNITLEQLCQPDYPAGIIQWLAAFSPALHRELTSRLPDKIQRLWEAQAPLSDFEAACTELVECHRSAVELFRRHRGDHHESR